MFSLFPVVLSMFRLLQRNHKPKKRKKNLTQISQTFRHDMIFLGFVYKDSCHGASHFVGRCYISEALTYRNRIKCIPLVRISLHFWLQEVFEALRVLGFKFRDSCKRI